jgi:hypothetical protein
VPGRPVYSETGLLRGAYSGQRKLLGRARLDSPSWPVLGGSLQRAKSQGRAGGRPRTEDDHRPMANFTLAAKGYFDKADGQ